MNNNLVVIENGKLNTYMLDDKEAWEVGRLSRNSSPDIAFCSPTVSRKHGKFQNMDGIWFYLDYSGKNGTVYKDEKIKAGARGRIKPILLSDKDVLIFGGGANADVNSQTIWTMYSTKSYEDNWNVVDTKGKEQLEVTDGIHTRQCVNLKKGTVIELEHGTVIYMGEVSFVTGGVSLK